MRQLPFRLNSDDLEREVNAALRSGFASLVSEEPMKMSEYSDIFFYLSAESSNVEGRWETLPYQRAIMNAIGNDDIRVVTWMKAARVGYTKIIMAAINYFTAHRRRNQLLYQPTDGDAEDFVKSEINPLIRDVPTLASLMRTDPETKSKDNTLQTKAFVGSLLDIRGGKSAKNYRRMTKDNVFYDELDGFDSDIEGEGSPTSLGDKRTSGSSFPKSIRGSTPRVKGFSLIENSFNEADKRFYRMLLCPHCDHYFSLSWKLITFREHDPASAMCGCGNCGTAFGYNEYPSLDAGGRWQAEDGTYINDADDCFYGPDDAQVVPPKHVAFHLSALYSYYFPWQDAVEEFLKANEAKKKGDRTKMKTFANTVLGEPSEEDKADIPAWYELKTRAEPYEQLVVPSGVLMLVVGTDVQNDRLAMVIVGVGRGEETWRLYQGELYGDPLHADVWKQHDELLERSYPRLDGGKMKVVKCAIDSGGGRTQSVYNYVRARSPRVIAIKGSNQPNRPIIGRPTNQEVVVEGITVPDGVKLWPVGTDTAKAQIYGRLRIKDAGPGCWHFPLSMRDDYYKQLVSEQLISKFHKGVPYQEWHLPSGQRNEALDCEVYATAAYTLLINDPRFSWDLLAREIMVQSNLDEPITGAAPKPTRRTVSQGDSSWLGNTKGWMR